MWNAECNQSSCIKDDRCTKGYTESFTSEMTTSDVEYPNYPSCRPEEGFTHNIHGSYPPVFSGHLVVT